MAGRILLGAIVSAVLMFAWGFLFWGVLGIGGKFLEPLPAELDVLAALRGSQAPSGMFVYPAPPKMGDEQGHAEFEAKHEEGPLLRMAYRAEGAPAMQPAVFARGLILNFVVALLTASVIAYSLSGLSTFSRRLAVGLLISLIASIWTNIGDTVWWFHSPSYCLGNIAYMMGAGLLMALVIATIVRPPSTEPGA